MPVRLSVPTAFPSALLLLGSLGLAAQDPIDTLPSGFMNREGDARHWVPVQFAPSRAQTTFDPSVVALSSGSLSRLYLRPDVEHSSQPMLSHSVQLSIHMASLGLPSASQVIESSYAANRGSDRRRVLDNVTVNIPAFTPLGTGPGPWSISIPILPFPYQAGNGLQIEWDVNTPASGATSWNWFADAERFDPVPSYGFFRRTNERDACPSVGTTYAGQVGGPGELMEIWFSSLAAPGIPAVTFLGLSDQTWNGQSLPIDLAAIGIPGCKVWTDLTAGIFTQVDATGGTGRVGTILPIVRDTTFAGLRLYSQTFVFDTSFQSGLRASDLGVIQIGNNVPRRLGKHLYTYTTPFSDRPEFAMDLAPIVGVR
jgi:hypothetical protein